MKSRSSIINALLGLLLGWPALAAAEALSPPVPSAPPAPSTPGVSTRAVAPLGPSLGGSPRIEFVEPNFDFGQVAGGETVTHTFLFTNTGTGLLVVSDVRPTCGCTTTGNWSRQVEPGQGGSIPIEFHSGNFNGLVSKQITVTCNDSNQPMVSLQLKGTVWRPIELIPPSASFSGTADALSNATRTIRIVNHTDELVELTNITSTHKAFSVEIRTNRVGKEWEMLVRLMPTLNSGNAFGEIRVQTTSPKTPLLSASAWAVIQQAVIVSPSVVSLPGGPLPAKVTVSVRSMWASPLKLSEPELNIPGAEVRLSELQPGKYFQLTLIFPEGFSVKPGQKAELSLKSNHPQFQVLRVPITQRVATPSAFLPPAPPR